MQDKQVTSDILENQQTMDRVDIVFYTDPLCCWSWGFEPQWRRLRYEFEGKIRWQYRMGGMLPNWNSFQDPFSDVSRPVQMGPVWMQAHHLTGQPLPDHIWMKNPPQSSFPACMAVKAAQLQSADAAELLLRRLREAVMLREVNIGEQEQLNEEAAALAREHPELFSYAAFEQAFQDSSAKDAFREDLQQLRYMGISRYPTLTIHKAGSKGVMIVGYRPYENLLQAIQQVAPGLEPVRQATDPEAYRQYWGTTTPKELEEALVANEQELPG